MLYIASRGVMTFNYNLVLVCVKKAVGLVIIDVRLLKANDVNVMDLCQ